MSRDTVTVTRMRRSPVGLAPSPASGLGLMRAHSKSTSRQVCESAKAMTLVTFSGVRQETIREASDTDMRPSTIALWRSGSRAAFRATAMHMPATEFVSPSSCTA